MANRINPFLFEGNKYLHKIPWTHQSSAGNMSTDLRLVAYILAHYCDMTFEEKLRMDTCASDCNLYVMRQLLYYNRDPRHVERAILATICTFLHGLHVGTFSFISSSEVLLTNHIVFQTYCRFPPSSSKDYVARKKRKLQDYPCISFSVENGFPLLLINSKEARLSLKSDIQFYFLLDTHSGMTYRDTLLIETETESRDVACGGIFWCIPAFFVSPQNTNFNFVGRILAFMKSIDLLLNSPIKQEDLRKLITVDIVKEINNPSSGCIELAILQHIETNVWSIFAMHTNYNTSAQIICKAWSSVSVEGFQTLLHEKNARVTWVTKRLMKALIHATHPIHDLCVKSCDENDKNMYILGVEGPPINDGNENTLGIHLYRRHLFQFTSVEKVGKRHYCGYGSVNFDKRALTCSRCIDLVKTFKTNDIFIFIRTPTIKFLTGLIATLYCQDNIESSRRCRFDNSRSNVTINVERTLNSIFNCCLIQPPRATGRRVTGTTCGITPLSNKCLDSTMISLLSFDLPDIQCTAFVTNKVSNVFTVFKTFLFSGNQRRRFTQSRLRFVHPKSTMSSFVRNHTNRNTFPCNFNTSGNGLMWCQILSAFISYCKKCQPLHPSLFYLLPVIASNVNFTTYVMGIDNMPYVYYKLMYHTTQTKKMGKFQGVESKLVFNLKEANRKSSVHLKNVYTDSKAIFGSYIYSTMSVLTHGVFPSVLDHCLPVVIDRISKHADIDKVKNLVLVAKERSEQNLLPRQTRLFLDNLVELLQIDFTPKEMAIIAKDLTGTLDWLTFDPNGIESGSAKDSPMGRSMLRCSLKKWGNQHHSKGNRSMFSARPSVSSCIRWP